MRRASWLALGVGIALAAGCGGGSAPGSSGTGARPGPTTTATSHLATLPLGSTTSATLDIQSGVSVSEVAAANLPGQLLTAVTPGNSGVAPSLTTDSNGIVHVELSHVAGGGGRSRLVVVVNRAVTWSIFLEGGASGEQVNLRDAKVNVVGIGAGVSRALVTLPRPTGTDLLRVTAGASRLSVAVPKGYPTRVRVKGGASSVRIGSRRHTGIGPVATFDAPGYPAARNRIDLEIEAGVSALSVQPY